ncbi:unnamed protein product [Brachionus calyciflorus]|uniref:Apple domain-containing protein n=1 Tax=Brachionus calyciflorus TaxID=104777 RepID=A0A814MPS0_9BILA|nr:unnamed protein product [Brachionus calyciflorus]
MLQFKVLGLKLVIFKTLAYSIAKPLNFEYSFRRINSINQSLELNNDTQIDGSYLTKNKFDCFVLCSKKHNCYFVQFKQNNCSLYNLIKIDNLTLDGSFWFKKNIDYPGLTTKYPLKSLTNVGFRLIYDQFYSHATSSIVLDNIKNQCLKNSILCVGGGLANSDILQLVSCGNCQSVLTPTELDKPVFVGSAYWYRTPSKSFGFSPVYFIYQFTADNTDYKNPLRLSWHLDGGGGWRLGSLLSLDSSKSYKKFIFIRY